MISLMRRNLGRPLAYRMHVFRQVMKHGFAKAMPLAIGGSDAVGDWEIALLDHFGFRDGSYLIDIGCGSGRLTRRVARLPGARYLGTDVSSMLLKHARATCNRPDFRFQRVSRPTIPEGDGSADMVCFFSVGTHLLNEEFIVYLEEARRVLKPAGRVVFSYLDLRSPAASAIFADMVNVARKGRRARLLNVFFNEETIRVWGGMLDMACIEFLSGSEARLVPSDRVSRLLGKAMGPIDFAGQSIAVLEKKASRGSAELH